MGKEYRIGKCTTVDVESGEDFLPPFYKVYSVEDYDELPTVCYEAEFDTLDEAKEYIKKKSMSKWADKLKRIIEDELFKATPDEAIEFSKELKGYLEYVITEMEKEKSNYEDCA